MILFLYKPIIHSNLAIYKTSLILINQYISLHAIAMPNHERQKRHLSPLTNICHFYIKWKSVHCAWYVDHRTEGQITLGKFNHHSTYSNKLLIYYDPSWKIIPCLPCIERACLLLRIWKAAFQMLISCCQPSRPNVFSKNWFYQLVVNPSLCSNVIDMIDSKQNKNCYMYIIKGEKNRQR